MKPGNTDEHAQRKPDGKWAPGVSGNPKGRPAKLQAVRDAIDECRDPEKVKRMLTALFNRGMEGDNFAAKLWLEHIAPLKDEALPDLTNAPDEVVEWLRSLN